MLVVSVGILGCTSAGCIIPAPFEVRDDEGPLEVDIADEPAAPPFGDLGLTIDQALTFTIAVEADTRATLRARVFFGYDQGATSPIAIREDPPVDTTPLGQGDATRRESSIRNFSFDLVPCRENGIREGELEVIVTDQPFDDESIEEPFRAIAEGARWDRRYWRVTCI